MDSFNSFVIYVPKKNNLMLNYLKPIVKRLVLITFFDFSFLMESIVTRKEPCAVLFGEGQTQVSCFTSLV